MWCHAIRLKWSWKCWNDSIRRYHGMRAAALDQCLVAYRDWEDNGRGEVLYMCCYYGIYAILTENVYSVVSENVYSCVSLICVSERKNGYSCVGRLTQMCTFSGSPSVHLTWVYSFSQMYAFDTGVCILRLTQLYSTFDKADTNVHSGVSLRVCPAI